MRNRTFLLSELIHNPLPDPDIIQELAKYPMTFGLPLATVSRADFLAILRQFEDGKLNASQLEEWATRIEARRDIGFEFGEEGVVEEALFYLAHRNIYGSIDSEQCRRIESMFERRCEGRSLH
jgi:predicted type IV restriction endonuclease